MGAPQVIWIALAAVGVAIAGVKHGQSRGNYSLWETAIGVSVGAGLIYWGGFFG